MLKCYDLYVLILSQWVSAQQFAFVFRQLYGAPWRGHEQGSVCVCTSEPYTVLLTDTVCD